MLLLWWVTVQHHDPESHTLRTPGGHLVDTLGLPSLPYTWSQHTNFYLETYSPHTWGWWPLSSFGCASWWTWVNQHTPLSTVVFSPSWKSREGLTDSDLSRTILFSWTFSLVRQTERRLENPLAPGSSGISDMGEGVGSMKRGCSWNIGIFFL